MNEVESLRLALAQRDAALATISARIEPLIHEARGLRKLAESKTAEIAKTEVLARQLETRLDAIVEERTNKPDALANVSALIAKAEAGVAELNALAEARWGHRR